MRWRTEREATGLRAQEAVSLRATMRWRTEREATGPRGAWSVHAIDLERDLERDPERDPDAVSHLDASDTGDRAGAVHRRGDGVALAPTAITAARRLGFEIGGSDTTPDRGTSHQGEVAVLMAHWIDGRLDPSEETS